MIFNKLYFNYVYSYHPHEFTFRQCRWRINSWYDWISQLLWKRCKISGNSLYQGDIWIHCCGQGLSIHMPNSNITVIYSTQSLSYLPSLDFWHHHLSNHAISMRERTVSHYWFACPRVTRWITHPCSHYFTCCNPINNTGAASAAKMRARTPRIIASWLSWYSQLPLDGRACAI